MTKKVSLFVGAGIIAPSIIEDIAIAFRQYGYSIDFIPLSEQGAVLAKRLDSVKPDIVFSLDAKGLNYPEVQACDAMRMAWFVDNPLYFSELDALDSLDHIFVWDRAYVPIVEEKGFQHVHFLPLATNPTRFHDQLVAEDVRARFECEACFVGTLGKAARVLRQERIAKYPAEINTLVDKLITVVENLYVPEQYEQARAVLKQVFDTIERPAHPLLYLLVDVEVNAVKRRALVDAAGAFQARLFGGNELQDCETGSMRYMGPAQYTTDVRAIYQSAAIVLNATRPQLISTVNQRLFDVFSCGGFLLTDYRPDLHLVASKEDVSNITFTDVRELKDKISYYCAHPDERGAIAERIRARIIESHTYMCRVEEMLAVVKQPHSAPGKN